MLIFLTFLLGMSFISLGTDASRHEIGSQLRRALQADTSVADQQEVILSKETDIQEPVLSQCIGLKLEDCEKLLKKKYPKAEVVTVPTKQYDYNRILIRYNNETGKCDLAPGRG